MNTLAECEAYAAELIERLKADPNDLQAIRELYDIIKTSSNPQLADLTQELANKLMAAQVLQWHETGDPRYERINNLFIEAVNAKHQGK